MRSVLKPFLLVTSCAFVIACESGSSIANLTGDGTWSFAYDAENRLLTANKTTGGTVVASLLRGSRFHDCYFLDI